MWGFRKLHFVAPHGGVTPDTVIWTDDSNPPGLALGDYKMPKQAVRGFDTIRLSM
jgi:hypothetical protein